MVADKLVQHSLNLVSELKDRDSVLRKKVYELIQEVNDLDQKVWKREHSEEVRGKFKRIKYLLNAL